MATTPSSSSNGSSSSKSLSPPTIANRASHDRILDRFHKLGFGEKVSDASDVPGHLAKYVMEHSLRPSEEERGLLQQVEQLPRAMMAGSPDEANFLCLMLELLNAKTVIEVGVFRGITTLALAQCLAKMETNDKDKTSKRKVIGLDLSEDYAAVGKEYWKKAGVDDRIDFRVGDAKESLATLLHELGENSVDLCFIDADKSSYDDYYEKCLKMTRPGGLVVVDNTLWGSGVAIPDDVLDEALQKVQASDNAELVERMKDTIAIKALNAKIHADDRIERVSFLTIADGVTLCRKK